MVVIGSAPHEHVLFDTHEVLNPRASATIRPYNHHNRHRNASSGDPECRRSFPDGQTARYGWPPAAPALSGAPETLYSCRVHKRNARRQEQPDTGKMRHYAALTCLTAVTLAASLVQSC